jgi:prepilin-type N-terminal cleavage/methylation domain-containing protein
MKNNKKGFTLIELLVVIAIIGLLATLSIIALNSAQAKARDVKRLSDVREIRTALEMYFASENSYPASLSTGDPIEDTASTTFMREYPTPPSPADGDCTVAQNTEYSYTLHSSNSSYSVSFCLGSNVNEVTAGVRTMTPAGIY